MINDSKKRRFYSYLLDPREHPDYNRRYVRPPSWEVFRNHTQFTSLREFTVKDGKIIRYVEDIGTYTRTYELGDVIWPMYPFLYAANLNEVVEEIKRRGLFLFDIWAYLPGCAPASGYVWQQFKVPAETSAFLESELGDRWLGMDVGEQDGRYVGGYAPETVPASAGRFEQYLNFQRFFERVGDDLGNKLSVLLSLSFGHYLLKEGLYATVGAETAQGLPNGQVYYAFKTVWCAVVW